MITVQQQHIIVSTTVGKIPPPPKSLVSSFDLWVLFLFWPQTDNWASVHHLDYVGHIDVLVQLNDLLHPLNLSHAMI